MKGNIELAALIFAIGLISSAAIVTFEVNVTVTDKPITQHVGEVHVSKVKERK